MLQVHKTAGKEHFKTVIAGEKGLQQILLIPKSLMLKNPFARIFRRQEDVVNVHYHALLKTRKDLQIFILHVRANFKHMAGIDKQYVVFSQSLKFR